MTATLTLHPGAEPVCSADTLVIVGRRDRLLAEDVRACLPAGLPAQAWEDMVRRGNPGDSGRTASTHTGGSPRKVVAGVLPEACSRHNTPSRAWAIPALIRAAGRAERVGVVLAVDEAAHAYPAFLAAARGVPGWKATAPGEHHFHACALAPDGPVTEIERAAVACEAQRLAARLVDLPPNQLTTSAFVVAARELASRLPATTVQVFEGESLRDMGCGGLWGVGQAAVHPPALVVLEHSPDQPEGSMAFVGKGIVFDTGGLSLKTRTGMPGMKTDMAGAAAVLAAFGAAVELGVRHRLTAVLCLAENAVGPQAMRPDDVITLLSGRTVEVNNTDAEGRLVLGDGVAWVAQNPQPDVLIDVATLTGAQSIATGKRHAALYCNDEALERRAIEAGRASGDLVHPLPYAPELFRPELTSQVADLRNSVKDRANAQSSCAGQFIGEHLGEFAGAWLHVDMAGPAKAGQRATGYGVGLLLTLAGVGA